MKMLLKITLDTGFVCLVTVDLIYLFIYLSDIFNIVFLCSSNPCNFFLFLSNTDVRKRSQQFCIKQTNKQTNYI